MASRNKNIRQDCGALTHVAEQFLIGFIPQYHLQGGWKDAEVLVRHFDALSTAERRQHVFKPPRGAGLLTCLCSFWSPSLQCRLGACKSPNYLVVKPTDVLMQLMGSARGAGFGLQACISWLSSLYLRLSEFLYLQNEAFFKQNLSS